MTIVYFNCLFNCLFQVDVFSHDVLLLPVHLGMHWCLAAVDFRSKQICYYDSFKGSNRQCLVMLR